MQMKLQGDKTGKKGHLSVATEVTRHFHEPSTLQTCDPGKKETMLSL